MSPAATPGVRRLFQIAVEFWPRRVSAKRLVPLAHRVSRCHSRRNGAVQAIVGDFVVKRIVVEYFRSNIQLVVQSRKSVEFVVI